MKLNKIKFGKLNILDIAIIVIIVSFVLLFIMGRINSTNNEKTNTINSNISTTFSYTIFIEGLSDTSKEMFKIGDEVYDKVSNVYIGKIKNLEITPAMGLIDTEKRRDY